ncbi:hypothetical protein D6783_00965 [Candidatus Woesearchaeota archaeon]|nr:MAG: hypothetical protein D6783_00965 [Candidatus Woesearchaeota archaeon]
MLSFRVGERLSSVISPPLHAVVSFLILLVLLFVVALVQKLVALRLGYVASYRFFPGGVLFGFLVFFLSFGAIPLFFPGYLVFEPIPSLRMGVFRPGVKNWELALVGVSSVVFGAVLVAFVLGPLSLLSGGVGVFFHEVMVYVLALMVFSLIPVPFFSLARFFLIRRREPAGIEEGTIGFSLLYASRTPYVFVLVATLAFAVLALLAKVVSLLLAILIGLGGVYVYKRFLEAA